MQAQTTGSSKMEQVHTQQFCCTDFPHYISAKEWPANSPDINVMDNICGIMDDHIKMAQSKTKDQLIKCMRHKLSMETIRKTIASIPQRLQQVIAKKGKATTYW